MNAVFFAIVLVSFLVAAFRQITFTPQTPDAEQPMQVLAAGMIDTAGSSVTLAISLIGVMTLFLGLMKVAEGGGLLVIIARLLRPLMVRLFPDVPAEHPAMGAMIMNFSANVMGLGNAATPFGIRAMQALDSLNQHRGTATNAMVLFLAINTSSVTLLPTGVRFVRRPAQPIRLPFYRLRCSTLCSTAVAIASAKLLQRWFPITETAAATPADGRATASSETPDIPTPIEQVEGAYPTWVSLLALAAVIALIPLTIFYGRAVSMDRTRPHGRVARVRSTARGPGL